MSGHPGYGLKRSKYRLLGLVGQGQFGRVYCAVHRQTGQLVALKNLDHQRFPTNKFLRELRFLISLQHPNIVGCYALEHSRTGRYLVMDYCEGGTLRGLMQEENRPSPAQSIQLILDVLSGLQHAHSRGIVHCDIKPENILLNVTAMGWTARISDFGIARLSQELDVPQLISNTGSPAYMAPERFYGQYSPASDLYSVGILLYEMLAGDRPFSGTPDELRSAHLNRSLQFSNAIPEQWRSILTIALQKLAARRFHSAEEMRSAIQTVAAESDRMRDAPRRNSALPLSPLLSPSPPTTTNATQSFTLPVALWDLTVGTDASNRLSTGDRTAQKTGTVLYGVSDTQVWSLSVNCQTAPSSPPVSRPLATLPPALKQLKVCPQGCFAIAASAVYFIPFPTASSGEVDRPYQSIYQRSHNIVAQLESQGRWLAAIALPSDGQPVRLTLMSVPHSPTWVGTAPRSLPLQTTIATDQTQRLFALDSHHVALISGLVPPGFEPGQNSTTQLEVWTRRGDRVGALLLPIPLRHLVPSALTYRFLAIAAHSPQTALLIDLQPFRITRIGLDIAPHLLVATSWGYILADAMGKMVVLSDSGEKVGEIAGPAHPTAIAPYQSHKLAVATWDGTRSQLHLLNLKELMLDFLF